MLVSLVGYDVMMVLAFLVGAMNIAPFKYMWWFAGFVFLILIVIQLVQRFEGANDGYKLCNYIFIATACVYPLGVCVCVCVFVRVCARTAFSLCHFLLHALNRANSTVKVQTELK